MKITGKFASTEGTDRFAHERDLNASGLLRIAGSDEAGRGPLAGPVCAAAVVFPSSWIAGGLPKELAGLNDSKQLSEKRREEFQHFILTSPEIAKAVVVVDAAEIDRVNILRASLEGMRRALDQLAPEHALIDGNKTTPWGGPQTALVKGDSRSFSIAAASVLAKVHRDFLMVEYDRQWPQYGFAIHKGYPTPQHLEALRQHGPCPIHRRSFAPLKVVQLGLFERA